MHKYQQEILILQTQVTQPSNILLVPNNKLGYRMVTLCIKTPCIKLGIAKKLNFADCRKVVFFIKSNLLFLVVIVLNFKNLNQIPERRICFLHHSHKKP